MRRTPLRRASSGRFSSAPESQRISRTSTSFGRTPTRPWGRPRSRTKSWKLRRDPSSSRQRTLPSALPRRGILAPRTHCPAPARPPMTPARSQASAHGRRHGRRCRSARQGWPPPVALLVDAARWKIRNRPPDADPRAQTMPPRKPVGRRRAGPFHWMHWRARLRRL